MDAQPSPCQLCAGDEGVNHQCSRCGQFCSHCQHIHARHCSAPVTYLKEMSSKVGKGGAIRSQGQGQVEGLETYIELLKNNLKKVRDHRQTTEHQLHARFAKCVCLLTKARDDSLIGLKERSKQAEDRLLSELSAAQEARAQMSQSRLTGPQGKQWVSDTVMARFEGCRKRGSTWSLSHESGPSSAQVGQDDCFKGFTDRVVIRGEQPDDVLHGSLVSERSRDSQPSSVQNGAAQTAHDLTDHAHSNRRCDPYSQDFDLAGKFGALSKMTTSLQPVLNAAKQLWSHMYEAVLCKDVKEIMRAKMRTELQPHDDTEILRAENTQLQPHDDTEILRAENTQLQPHDDTEILRAENTQLQPHDDTEILRAENTQLEPHDDTEIMRAENTQLEPHDDTEILRAENTQLESHDDTEILRAENTHLQPHDDTEILRAENTQLQPHDITRLQQDISDLRQEVQDLQKSKAMAKKQVAFHVELFLEEKVKAEQVLILRYEIVNIDQCYNINTGYFTAPVSGVYLFMATTSSATDGQHVSLDIVHEGEDVGYLSGEESCTGHVALRVAQGDKVWLRTFKPGQDEDMNYAAGSLTSFSGVLVQPDF